MLPTMKKKHPNVIILGDYKFNMNVTFVSTTTVITALDTCMKETFLPQFSEESI